MKSTNMLFVLALAAVLVASCGEKKQTNDIITHKEVKKAPAKPMRMQDYNHSEKVAWLGTEYTVSIGRRAENDSSLVADDAGNKYHNNRITVRIVRPDGSEFFDRTFTKHDFANVVGADYLSKSTLLGIVVDSVDGNGMRLAASVGSPDALSDEYVPLIITVSRTGSISIEKDTRPETDVAQDDEEG